MTAYQLMADTLDSLDIHNGTMFRFQQNRYKYATEDEYQNAMELLQYDILYGDHYVYGGGNPYPASNLIMGTQDVVMAVRSWRRTAIIILSVRISRTGAASL